MKIQHVTAVAIVTGLIGWTAGTGFGEDQPPSAEQMIEQMREMGQPGPMHKLMNRMAGSWNVDVSAWHGPEPTKSKATSTSTWMLGSRFLKIHYEGEMFGQPFNGFALMGYNNGKQQFESIWVDDFSSNISSSKGQPSADGRTITFHGVWEGPNDMKSAYRMVYAMNEDGGYRVISYAQQGEDEVKEMELVYSRAVGVPATTPTTTPATTPTTPATTPAPSAVTYWPCPPVRTCRPRPACRPRCR